MLVTILLITVVILSVALGFSICFVQKLKAGGASVPRARALVAHSTDLESQLLKDIFQTFPDGMIFRDMSGRAVFYNEALLQAWQPSEYEEFMTAPKEKWLRYPNSDSYLQPNTSPTARALKGETVISEELVVSNPTFADRHILVTAIPVFHNGQQYGAFSVTRDVHNLTRDFEFRSQRSRLDALGTLAGGIAHDFNNQLATIMGSAQIALTELHQHRRVSEYLETIVSVCKSGSQLTRQLMSLGQIRSGDSVDVDLHGFLRKFKPIIDRVFQAYADIDITIEDKALSIYCDPAQLESAILNLLLNAKDATIATQERKVSVRFEEYVAHTAEIKGLKEGQAYVAVRVVDNGSGMSEEVRRRAIEPFFTTKSDGNSGFGLGLTAVNGFVSQCKGVITIDSVVGGLTTVTLYLPHVSTVTETDLAGESGIVTQGDGETVLLVEDRAELRNTLARMISGLNYKVITASGGEEGIQQFNHNPQIDVALVDVVLPGSIGGVKMIDQIRKIRPDIRVIFMSGYFNEAQQFSVDPEQPYLQKPISRSRLARELTEVLSQ